VLSAMLLLQGCNCPFTRLVKESLTATCCTLRAGAVPELLSLFDICPFL
jgi:hypothetical protein